MKWTAGLYGFLAGIALVIFADSWYINKRVDELNRLIDRWQTRVAAIGQPCADPISILRRSVPYADTTHAQTSHLLAQNKDTR